MIKQLGYQEESWWIGQQDTWTWTELKRERADLSHVSETGNSWDTEDTGEKSIIDCLAGMTSSKASNRYWTRQSGLFVAGLASGRMK